MMQDQNRADATMGVWMGALLLMMLIGAAHFTLETHRLATNLIMTGVGLAALLFTYMKNLKWGLLVGECCALILFIAIWIGRPSGALPFLFWPIWIVLACLIVNRIHQLVHGLQVERDYYRDQAERVSLVDALTQMKNLHAYRNDAPVYMKLAKRYHLRLALMVWELENAKELQNLLLPSMYRELMQAISSAMRASVRTEDMAYFVDNDTSTWCLMMFTNIENIGVVEERLRGRIARIATEYSRDGEVLLKMNCGTAGYDNDAEVDPDGLLRQACEAMREARLK